MGRARDRGAIVLVQVGDVADAVTAVHRGADIVIAQGMEAGGHVQGTTPLVQLLREMRAELELPIVAAGGIADGVSARAALAAGADAVACGTAFLAAREADVHPAYLDRLLRAGATDMVLTTIFDVGWPNAPIASSGMRPSRVGSQRESRTASTGALGTKTSSRRVTASRWSDTATLSRRPARRETSRRWRCTRECLSAT